jgi:hypothetical protein
MKGPELRTIDVDVQDIDARGKTLHGYAAVYGALSEPLKDLGGARERIAHRRSQASSKAMWGRF